MLLLLQGPWGCLSYTYTYTYSNTGTREGEWGTARCCARARLRLRLARRLAEQLRLLERAHTCKRTGSATIRHGYEGERGIRTVLDEELLVVDDRDVLLCQVLDLAVLDFPQLLGDLRNQTCTHAHVLVSDVPRAHTHTLDTRHTTHDTRHTARVPGDEEGEGRQTYGSRARR